MTCISYDVSRTNVHARSPPDDIEETLRKELERAEAEVQTLLGSNNNLEKRMMQLEVEKENASQTSDQAKMYALKHAFDVELQEKNRIIDDKRREDVAVSQRVRMLERMVEGLSSAMEELHAVMRGGSSLNGREEKARGGKNSIPVNDEEQKVWMKMNEKYELNRWSPEVDGDSKGQAIPHARHVRRVDDGILDV